MAVRQNLTVTFLHVCRIQTLHGNSLRHLSPNVVQTVHYEVFCHLVSRLDTFRQRMSDFSDNLSNREDSTRYEFLLFILCLLSCVFIICYTLLYVLYPKRYRFFKKNFLSTVNTSDSNGYRGKIFFIVEFCLLFF